MHIENVKRSFYWAGFFIFLMILFLTFSSTRMSFFFRSLIVVLLSLLSSWFRMDNKFSPLCIVLSTAGGIILGGIMANSMPQFWFFTILFIATFFGGAYVWEKNLLGI